MLYDEWAGTYDEALTSWECVLFRASCPYPCPFSVFRFPFSVPVCDFLGLAPRLLPQRLVHSRGHSAHRLARLHSLWMRPARYPAPARVAEIARELLQGDSCTDPEPLHILDLGCGTGTSWHINSWQRQLCRWQSTCAHSSSVAQWGPVAAIWLHIAPVYVTACVLLSPRASVCVTVCMVLHTCMVLLAPSQVPVWVNVCLLLPFVLSGLGLGGDALRAALQLDLSQGACTMTGRWVW